MRLYHAFIDVYLNVATVMDDIIIIIIEITTTTTTTMVITTSVIIIANFARPILLMAQCPLVGRRKARGKRVLFLEEICF